MDRFPSSLTNPNVSAGEDRLLSCGSCGYTANEERARSKSSHEPQVDAPAEMVEIAHAAAASNKTLEPATEFYSGRNFSAQLVLEGKTHVVVVGKAHRKISDIKVGKLVVQASQAANGGSLAIILDTAVAESMPAAAKTLASSLGSSVPILVEDVLVAEAGDLCPTCTDGSQLQKLQGIEVGHAFHLGQRYSLPLAAAYKALDGSRQVMVPFSMGCFGIGVSRILGAVVQISHDKDGIIWPESLAPYKVCIIPTFNTKRREVEEQPVVEAAERMYDELEKAHPSRYAGEVVIDDRWDMTFGQRIREAMLVGYPYVVVLGQGYLRNGAADLITRCNNNKQQMAATEAASFLVQMP